MSENADLNRNVLRCGLNCSVLEIQRISEGKRFHCRGAATENARSPCLSLVRGINMSHLERCGKCSSKRQYLEWTGASNDHS